MAWFGGWASDSLALLLVLTTFAVLYFRKKYKYWQDNGVVSVPPFGPFGNFARLIFKLETWADVIERLYFELKKTGQRYGGVYFLGGGVFYPIDLDLIKCVMTRDFQHFTDRSLEFNEDRDPLAANLLNLNGLKWKNLRNKLSPTFTSGKMKMMFHTLLVCGEGLKAVMDDSVMNSDPVNIKDVLGRFTTDVIGSCAFGIECNSLKEPNNDFRRYGKRIFDQSLLESLKTAFAITCPKLQDFLGIHLVPREIHKFFMNLVKETISYRETNNVQRNDFMQLLIKTKNEDTIAAEKNKEDKEVGTHLTVGSVAAQAFLFYAAGFETSSTTMTFCFYELAVNPDIQDKLREEIIKTLDKCNGEITYEFIMDMSYLDKVISETLRKYPPVPFLNRKCTMEYKVPESDLILDKGRDLFIPVIGIHRDPEYYPNPDVFDPERFNEDGKASRHPYAYLPFGEGPRNCIGLRFGLMQTKIGLSILLSKYKFRLNKMTKDPLVLDTKSFILSVKGDIWLDVERI